MSIRSLTGQLSRSTGTRHRPERVVLDVAEGVEPSGKPPVRIFLGTEPDQYRAERIFVWSIRRHRDPARVYEIHLMKDLIGFDKRGWTTGFTNFRFAIPDFAGREGRAIYNDVDQIYLADPAELFDLDMNGHGFLAIAERESSVMLIDCRRMSEVWTLEAAQSEGKKRLLNRALSRGLRGPLDGAWNARDKEEYEEGRSKLLHYTTLHTQPWRPFPSVFLYRRHPLGELWHDMERAADAEGFNVFTRGQPSRRYLDRRAHLAEAEPAAELTTDQADRHREAIARLVQRTRARTLLEGRLGAPAVALGQQLDGARVTARDLADGDTAALPRADGVLALGTLERAPEEDVPWVLDALFDSAGSFLYAAIACRPGRSRLANGDDIHATVRPPAWWQAQFEAAGRRHPEVGWELATAEPAAFGRTRMRWRTAGRWLDARGPRVWILDDGRAEDTAQSLALAEALGWPYEIKRVRFNGLDRLDHRLLDSTALSLDRSTSAELRPPWPDVVVAAGTRSAPIARWIDRRSDGRSRTIQLGRKAVCNADAYSATVVPAHARLPYHPRRIETMAPLTRVSDTRLAEAASTWPDLHGNAPRPLVVLLVGGTTARYRLDGTTALRLAHDVRDFAHAAGGSLITLTTRWTTPAACRALEGALEAPDRVHRWHRRSNEDFYHACLAAADVLVVTGESEALLADAAATGKPLYIYDLPKRRPGPGTRLAEAMVARAHAEPLNDRGTPRPQQRLERLCGRLLADGLLRPTRDLDRLHAALVEHGGAHRFGEPLTTTTRPALHEAATVAARVKALLGISG